MPASSAPKQQNEREQDAPIATPFYRTTTLGKSLTKSLNTLIASKQLTLAQAKEIQQNFDKSIVSVMKEVQAEGVRELLKDSLHSRKRSRGQEYTLEGELERYNNMSDQWSIDVTNAELKSGSRTLRIPRARFLFSAESTPKERRTTKEGMGF